MRKFFTRRHDAVIEPAHSNLSCLLQGCMIVTTYVVSQCCGFWHRLVQYDRTERSQNCLFFAWKKGLIMRWDCRFHTCSLGEGSVLSSPSRVDTRIPGCIRRRTPCNGSYGPSTFNPFFSLDWSNLKMRKQRMSIQIKVSCETASIINAPLGFIRRS